MSLPCLHLGGWQLIFRAPQTSEEQSGKFPNPFSQMEVVVGTDVVVVTVVVELRMLEVTGGAVAVKYEIFQEISTKPYNVLMVITLIEIIILINHNCSHYMNKKFAIPVQTHFLTDKLIKYNNFIKNTFSHLINQCASSKSSSKLAGFFMKSSWAYYQKDCFSSWVLQLDNIGIPCFSVSFYVLVFIYLFGVLRRFQHCTGHITTGSWKDRGNQYIEFARVVYCKLPTNGKQLPAFPLKAFTGIEPRPQRWEVRVLPLCHRGPLYVLVALSREYRDIVGW